MTLQACALNGKPGYQSGDDGTCYTYDDGNEQSRLAARQRATTQGMQRAEKAGDQYRQKMRREEGDERQKLRREGREDEERSVRTKTDAQIRAEKAKPKPPPARAASQGGVRGVHSSRPLQTDDSPIVPAYSKDEVGYGAGRDEQECGNCRFFENGACQLVKGAIDAEAYCRLFSPLDVLDLERDDIDGDDRGKRLTEGQLAKFYELKDVKLDDVQGARRSWVPVFPEGHFAHPEYGDLDFTDGELRKYMLNFRQRVRKIDIAVDIDHKNEDAVGWLKDLELRPGIGMFGLVEWNQHGAGLIADKRYRYISPQFGEYVDEESGTTYDPVLVALTITNFPFLKSMKAIGLRKKEAGGPTVIGKVAQTASRMKRAKQAADAAELDELDDVASDTPTDDEEEVPAKKPPFGAKRAKKAKKTDDEEAAETSELDDDESASETASELDEDDDSSAAEPDEDDTAKRARRASEPHSLRELREDNRKKDRQLRLLTEEMRETQRTLRLSAVREQVRQLSDGKDGRKVAFTKPVIDAFKEVALSDKQAGNALFKILSMVKRDGVVALSVNGRAADVDDERNDPTGQGDKVLRDRKTGKPIVGLNEQKRAQMFASENKLDWNDLEDRTKAYLATIESDDLDDDDIGYGRSK